MGARSSLELQSIYHSFTEWAGKTASKERQ